MATIRVFAKQTFTLLVAPIIAVCLLQTNVAIAQDDPLALEEVVVTAQRRAQSLKDVPMSIEVFSGAEMRKQGFRDLDDLANFSTSVLIEPRVQDQDVSIRGIGTTGNALTLDSATPFFVDGIHFGRPSQVKLAFLDVASVEVLKGPQPAYFGQNATAGAFNIRSRGPTAELEGYIDAELSEDSTQEITFGVGGPISDKWGYRVAGMYETTDGYLDYVVNDKAYGAYENTGGRGILTFSPNDRLDITAKVEAARIRKDSETISQCRTAGPLIFGRGGPLDDPDDPPGDERSVWDQSTGTAWSVPFTPLDTSCFNSKKSVSQGGPYFEPPQTMREENSNFGSVDIRAVGEGYARATGNNGIAGYEDLDSVSAYIDVAYSFENGTELQWLTGNSSYERDYVQDNSNSPFLMNFQGRGEDFDQLSTELRLHSGPDTKVQWDIGAFYQTTDLAAFSSSMRANVRQSLRYNFISEDVDFSAIFGTVTFNFMDDRMSLDIGGRFQDVDKFAKVEGYAASWIFTTCPETPCDLGLTPVSVAFDAALDDYAGCEGSVDGDAYCLVDPATANLFVDVAPGALLYAMPFRESRDVPVNWLPGNAAPVGVTQFDFARRVDRGEGPWAEKFTESGFSPQVTLRFRSSDNMSWYLRYAEATKIGGFDTGQTSIPTDVDELTFETEDAEQFELGVKGTIMEGRLSFDADIFNLEFPNLQTTAISPDPNQTSASVNAGQRVRGLEFNVRYAASEHWRLGFAGAFMDGEMTEFAGAGCTDSEIGAALVDASAPCQLFDGSTLVQPTAGNPLDAETAFDDYTALIDRTGAKAPRTPDWKFVLTADYTAPISSNYEINFTAKGYISDGYILDVESFSDIVDYDKHEDLNLFLGLRNVDGGWSVGLFARNLLEARPSYHADNDPFPNGLASAHLSPSSFTTYGVKFQYLID